MPVFPKPKFEFNYNLNDEKDNFDVYFTHHEIPAKAANEIDLATWNIANLGPQKRRDKDLKLIAHILSKFDIIAVQEVNTNLGHFNKVMQELGDKFDFRLTDSAGNSERLAVVYKKKVLAPRNLFGELDYNPNGKIVDGKYVVLPKKQKFKHKGKKYEVLFYNFNRNPFLSTWQVLGSSVSFLLANVHIYFGDDKADSAKFKNRVAEVFFLADWARHQQTAKKRENLYEQNVILIGDMNIPKMESDNPVYRALKRRGMEPSAFSTGAGTTIKEFTHYDQVVFTNKKLKVTLINKKPATVVDFDNFIFQDLWNRFDGDSKQLAKFKAWTKFAVSDHRPLFVRLKV